MRLFIVMLVGLIGFASAGVSQTTVFYLNFDEMPAGVYPNDGTYELGLTDVADLDSVDMTDIRFEFRSDGSADGPEIGAAPLSVATGTPQGGQVLLLDAGATLQDQEGLIILADRHIDYQDFTMEAVWFTDDVSGGASLNKIASIIGDEWPAGTPEESYSKFWMRMIKNLIFDYNSDQESPQGNRIRIEQAGYNEVLTWYHDALVFDYNEADPASSTFYGYRNGVLQGSSPYNADAGQLGMLFGWHATGPAALDDVYHHGMALGIDLGHRINPNDSRGLSGGIDAIAITLGVLSPGEFVLPAGTPYTSLIGQPHGGQYAARMEYSNIFVSGHDSGLDREDDPPAKPDKSLLSVTGGNEIQFSTWAKAGRAGSSDVFRVRMAAFDSSLNFIADSPDFNFPTQQDWQEFTGSWTLPANTSFLNFSFRMVTTNGGAVIVDDVSMVDLTAGNAPIPVSNGGFEDWPGSPTADPTDWRFFVAGGAVGKVQRVSLPDTASTGDCWMYYR